MREQNETQERCLMSSETKRNSGEVFDEFRNKTDLAPGGGEATAAKWNGKSAASATSTCDAYNLPGRPPRWHVQVRGTSGSRVSDKGPAGKCLVRRLISSH